MHLFLNEKEQQIWETVSVLRCEWGRDDGSQDREALL